MITSISSETSVSSVLPQTHSGLLAALSPREAGAGERPWIPAAGHTAGRVHRHHQDLREEGQKKDGLCRAVYN